MGDLERALAFVARRAGRRRMPASRWVHELSLGLGWMRPAEAKEFVRRAHTGGLLVGEDDLEFRLDPQSVEVPASFRPDIAARAAPRDAFQDVLAGLGGMGWDQNRVLAEVARVQEEFHGHLDALTAAWLVATRAGMSVKEAIPPPAGETGPQGTP